MMPLMFAKTNVLTTASVQNIAASSAGNATEVTVNLNSRISRYAAKIIATVLKKMNQYRDASTGR